MAAATKRRIEHRLAARASRRTAPLASTLPSCSRKVVSTVTGSSRSAPWLGSPASHLTLPPLLCLPAVGERKGRAGEQRQRRRGAGAPPAGRRAPRRGIGGGSSWAHAGGGAESSSRAAVPGNRGGWVRERWGEVGPTTDGGEI
jgi:hypothetical protein